MKGGQGKKRQAPPPAKVQAKGIKFFFEKRAAAIAASTAAAAASTAAPPGPGPTTPEAATSNDSTPSGCTLSRANGGRDRASTKDKLVDRSQEIPGACQEGDRTAPQGSGRASPCSMEASDAQDAAKSDLLSSLPQPTEGEKSSKRPRGSEIGREDQPQSFDEQASEHVQQPAESSVLVHDAKGHLEAPSAGPPPTRSYTRRKRERVQGSSAPGKGGADDDSHPRVEPLGTTTDRESCQGSADAGTDAALPGRGPGEETACLDNADPRGAGNGKARGPEGCGIDLPGDPAEQDEELLLQQVLDSLVDDRGEEPAEDIVASAAFTGKAPGQPPQAPLLPQPVLGDQSSLEVSRVLGDRQSMSTTSARLGGVASFMGDGGARPQQADTLSKTSDDEEEEAAQVLLGRTPATADHGIVQQVLETEYWVPTRNGSAYSQTQKELLVRGRAHESGDLIRVFLRDDWVDVPVSQGDVVAVLGDRQQPGGDAVAVGLHPSDLDSIVPEQQGVAGDNAQALAPSENRGKEKATPLEVVVDNSRGLFILHPNILVSGSRVSGSFTCARRAVLEDRIRKNEVQGAALRGTMLHRLLQCALRMENVSTAALEEISRDIATEHHSDILSLGETEDWALRMLSEGVPGVVKWVQAFLRPQPSPAASVDFGSRDTPRPACIQEVLDIEESIWSPRLGIKGMVDVSVRANLAARTAPGSHQAAKPKPGTWQHALKPCGQGKASKGPGAAAPARGSLAREGATDMGNSNAAEMQDMIMALELKTGKATQGQAMVDHRAQLMLYSLLMSERYELPIRTGLLLYLHTGQTLGVEAGRRELVGLIIRRNSHAAALKDAASTDFAQRRLPPVLESRQICGSCSMRDICSTYAKAEMSQAPESDASGGEVAGSVSLGGGTPGLPAEESAPAEFLRKWETLVDMEAAEMEALHREVWTMPSEERERRGRCIGNLELVEPVPDSGHAAMTQGETSEGKENLRHCGEGSTRRPTDGNLLQEAQGTAGSAVEELSRRRGERKAGRAQGKQQSPKPGASGSSSAPLAAADGMQEQGHLYTFRRRWVGGRPPAAALVPEPLTELLLRHNAGPSQESPAKGVPPPAQGPGGIQESPLVHTSPGRPKKLTDLPFAPGDHVVLSTEWGQVAVAMGTVADISADHVTVRTQRPLRIPGTSSGSRGAAVARSRAARVAWRVDRSESLGIVSTMRMNLVSLFLEDTAQSRLRELVVDLDRPREAALAADSSGEDGPDATEEYLSRARSEMNEDQQKAVAQALGSRDYTLIQGLPGCGKTATIIHLVKALLARDNTTSVLIASYTNTAVDNVLLKLLAQGVDAVRIGRREAVHQALRPFTYGDQPPAPMAVSQLQETLSSARVVGATCLGISHPIFSLRRFDVCIVDEACQVTLPVCLGPLRFGTSFVLVGDPQQLPPLVKSKDARAQGLQETLFARLARAHPQALVTLTTQYRMNEPIMALSNAVVYRGQLKCASQSVEKAVLELPAWERLAAAQPPTPPWLSEALEPRRAALFLDTDLLLGAGEQRVGDAILNAAERDLTLMILRGLLCAGAAPSQLAVLTPYNAQVKLLRSSLGTGETPAPGIALGDVEVETVDRFQGKDRECVIVSMVRSNEDGCAGALWCDVARLNVALTRAKRKLLLVGSASTLSRGSQPCRTLLKLMAEKAWTLQIPGDSMGPLAQGTRILLPPKDIA